MFFRAEHKKALTAVIALVLLLMMTVAGAGFFYIFSQALQTKAQTSVEETTTEQMESMEKSVSTCISIDSIHMNKLYLRNCGRGIIPKNKINVYIDGRPIGFSLADDNEEDMNAEVTLSENAVGKTLKVAYGGISTQSSIPEILVYLMDDEYESFSNGEACSHGLYVLENNRMIFFSSNPRTYKPNTQGVCSSGIQSYMDIYGASPCLLYTSPSPRD